MNKPVLEERAEAKCAESNEMIEVFGVEPLILTEDLKKVYRVGKVDVHALRGVNLTIQEGEFVAVVGPSGCGKSTLLRLIAGLEEVSAGEIVIGDRRTLRRRIPTVDDFVRPEPRTGKNHRVLH